MTPEMKSLTRLTMAGLGYNQAHLAAMLGINQRTLSKWIFSELNGTPKWRDKLFDMLEREGLITKRGGVCRGYVRTMVNAVAMCGYNEMGRKWKPQYRIENDPIIKGWLA